MREEKNLKQMNIEEIFFKLEFGEVRENYKLIEIETGKLTELNEEGSNINKFKLKRDFKMMFSLLSNSRTLS